MSSRSSKSTTAANLPCPTGSSRMDALTSFGLPIHSLSIGIAPKRDQSPLVKCSPTSDSSVLVYWLICLLPGTIISGRCPRSQRLVVRVHRFEVQHRSEKFICATAAQLPAKSLDMGVGRLGCSPDQPSEAPGWPVGLKTAPRRPHVKGTADEIFRPPLSRLAPMPLRAPLS